jgi:hypothetical protein
VGAKIIGEQLVDAVKINGQSYFLLKMQYGEQKKDINATIGYLHKRLSDDIFEQGRNKKSLRNWLLEPVKDFMIERKRTN